MLQKKNTSKAAYLSGYALFFCGLAVFLAGFFLPNVSIGSSPSPFMAETLTLPVSRPLILENLADPVIVADPKLPLADSSVKKTLRVTVTAYSSTPDQTDDTPFITATGNRVRDGIVAANFLPFGTRVRFPSHYGNKVFVVDDRMNERFYKRLDIWMPTREEAKNFGIKYLEVEIL